MAVSFREEYQLEQSYRKWRALEVRAGRLPEPPRQMFKPPTMEAAGRQSFLKNLGIVPGRAEAEAGDIAISVAAEREYQEFLGNRVITPKAPSVPRKARGVWNRLGTRNKLMIGAGVAVGALALTGNLFSAKNDVYNRIEGLHPGSEGLGAQVLRAHSDFGSGWIGGLGAMAQAPGKGIFNLLGRFRKTEQQNVLASGYELASGYRSQAEQQARVRLGEFAARKENMLKFPAMGDRGTMAASMRESLTEFKADFASRWDPLKKIAKEIFGAADDKAFAKLRGSSEFKKAITEASVVKELGYGATGTVSLMKGNVFGREFQFARKTGMVPEIEVAAMRAAEGTVGPSVYSGRAGEVAMEYFPGRILKESDLALDKALKGRVAQSYREVHKTGFLQGDPNLGNVMMVKTPGGRERIGLIDFGAAKTMSSYPSKSSFREAAEYEVSVVTGEAESRFFTGGLGKAAKKPAEEGFWFEGPQKTVTGKGRPDLEEAIDFGNLVPPPPPPATKSTFNKIAAERNRRFAEQSKNAVGVGLRSAKDAGKGHRRYPGTSTAQR